METVDRILVIAPAQIGDVLLCTPLIAAARARWPHARIDVLGFEGTFGLLSGHPEVGECIAIPRSSGRRAQWRQAWRMRRRYDLALVTRVGDRSHLYGFVAARVRSVLLPGGGGRGWKHLIADHGLVPAPHTHQVIEKLQLLGPWMALPAAVAVVAPPAVPLPPELEARLERPSVVVHVPSMWRYKQWPPAHFRHVVDGLLADGVQVLLTGSASATDQAQLAQVREPAVPDGLIDVSGQLSLAQVRTLLERVDAYLGPDTSVTHLAATVGLPIVTLFGPTNPQDFGPWPQGHAPEQPWQQRARRQQVGSIVVLQGPDLPGQACVPCNRMGCENRHDSSSHCLEGLEPERVLAELRALLAPR